MGLIRKSERKLAKQTRNAARLTAAASAVGAKHQRDTAHLMRELSERDRHAPEPSERVTLRSVYNGLRPGAAELPAAGWYPDPHGTAQMRFWDGELWTAHTQPPTPPALY